MEFGTVLSVAQILLTALQSSELKQICSILGYSSQLNDLHATASTIKAVLRDAEAKQDHLSNEAQLWIDELKDAIYDADDLLDEFATLVEQKRHLLEQGPQLSKRIGLFFSRFNPLLVAYHMSRGIKKVRKKLDIISCNHKEFEFSVDHQPIRRRREETCSYVYAGGIIGREKDLENVVKLLLDCNNVGLEVSYLALVGIGGLGKTALAQLLYNDERVASSFPTRLWACVSDHDEKELNIEAIFGKILASALGYKHEGLTMDRVQTQLRETLFNSRYLLF